MYLLCPYNVRHYMFYGFYWLRYAFVLESAAPLIDNVADRTFTWIRNKQTSLWMFQCDIIEIVIRQTLQAGKYSRLITDTTCPQDVTTPHDALDVVKCKCKIN